MTIRLTLALLLLSAPLLPACDDGGSDIDCATATVPKFTEMTAWDKCTSCHSSKLTGAARNAAPEGINYDNFTDARVNANAAMSEVEEGAMPLPGNPKLSDDEKTQIYTWASCETPQ